MTIQRPRVLFSVGGAFIAGLLCLGSYYYFETDSTWAIAVGVLLVLVLIDAHRRFTAHYIRPACLFLLGTASLYALNDGLSSLVITMASVVLAGAVLILIPDHSTKPVPLRNQIVLAIIFTEVVMLCSLLPSTAILQSALATIVVAGLLELMRYKRSEWWQVSKPYALLACALFICDISSLLIHP